MLTRILRPEDYGVITVILSIAFFLEMIADIGITVFVIRDPNAEEARYLNTAWTIRLSRALLSGAILYLAAPAIAGRIYHLPSLALPLRVFSLWFVIGGFESMAFALATRRKRARVTMYSELAATFVATVFTIAWCYRSRDYWGLVYGTLVSRTIVVMLSYRFYRELRPALEFDRAAAKAIFRASRYTVPSGVLTLALTQFDKVVLLRLFGLRELGVYGLAANIAGPIESLILKISQMVLYPRCARIFRSSPERLTGSYYTENMKVFLSLMLPPAVVGGAAQLIIQLLYPLRYSDSGIVLYAFMLRAGIIAFSSPAEDLLVAVGEYGVILIGSILRTAWMITASLIGYYYFGFYGFIYGIAANPLPALLYYWWRQRQHNMLILRYELVKLGLFIAVALLSYFGSMGVLVLRRHSSLI